MIAHYSAEGGGESIAGLGDLNGDGRADFVVPIGLGVSALSGVDRSELWHIDIDGVGVLTGYAMASAGDVDGDHIADLVVGTVSNGLVRVYSGATQAILYQWQAPIPDIAFGTCVAAAGDIDGDGHGDVIVGTQSGKAYVYSGADGHLVYAPYQVIPGDHFGELVSGAGDVNGDGFDDFMISARGLPGSGLTGHVYIYSGFSGAILHDIVEPNLGSGFGASMCAVGDVDHDGKSDLMIGSPYEDASI